MDANSGKLNSENMSQSANGKMVNAYVVSLMIKFRVHLIIHLELHLKRSFNIYVINDAQKEAPEVALKGTLLVAFYTCSSNC